MGALYHILLFKELLSKPYPLTSTRPDLIYYSHLGF